MNTGLTKNKGGSWDPGSPKLTASPGKDLFWRLACGCCSCESSADEWLQVLASFLLHIYLYENGHWCQRQRKIEPSCYKEKNLLVTQYNLYCLYDSYMVFWRILFMNNNGGSGNVGGITQWRVKQRTFCFTVISSVVRHFGLL